ncbi:MAG: arginine--tRNA ligase, partial [Clostridia bacterium]|nr:arginine--tRNA ligase [Clostridia bacterium]
MDFKKLIAAGIVSALGTAFGETSVTEETVFDALELPPDSAMGDYAFPCFKLAKVLHKAPPMIADALAAAIEGFPGRIESVKGYLNFYIDRALYAGEIVKEVLRAGDRYGGGEEGRGKTVCLDYSSINIAKRFHIGHLPSTVIGNALKNIYAFQGYDTVSINHLGDWGTQFGKMIAAYKMWGDRETVERGGVDEMVKLYVRFNTEAKTDESLNDKGRAWFKAIEDGNEEALEIFNWFKRVTLADAEKVYEILGVKFDSYAGESFYNDKMGPVLDEVREKGLLKEDQGAQIVDLGEYGMPPFIMLRSDGATLYATRDLAAAKYRHDTYGFDKCLYVVAYQQDLHFKQLFKVMELLGWDWGKGCIHVNFGMVSYEGQALSTREGHIVYLEDLLNTSIQKSLD